MAGAGDYRLTQRQKRIVNRVVAEHIRTAQPVGSRTLCERHRFECSPATIRNEMVHLERRGYLYQPHTSAGRVPLESAYRLYVDRLTAARPRLDRQMAWVQGEFRRLNAGPDAALQRTSGLLSQVTKYPAVVTRPSRLGGSAPRLTELSLTAVSAHNVLFSYADDEGNTKQTLIETEAPVKVTQVRALEQALRRSILGRQVRATPNLGETPPTDAGLLSGIRNALEEAGAGHVYVEGTTYILDQPEFAQLDRLRRVMKSFGRSPLLRRLLHTTAKGRRVAVTIGNEHGIDSLSECSAVAARYNLSGQSGLGGTVGVVGPMRMDYRLAMAAVGRVARELGQALSDASDQQ